eukprot:4456568-Prymnesium_polylepis.1
MVSGVDVTCNGSEAATQYRTPRLATHSVYEAGGEAEQHPHKQRQMIEAVVVGLANVLGHRKGGDGDGPPRERLFDTACLRLVRSVDEYQVAGARLLCREPARPRFAHDKALRHARLVQHRRIADPASAVGVAWARDDA